jgi:hypothetical protein
MKHHEDYPGVSEHHRHHSEGYHEGHADGWHEGHAHGHEVGWKEGHHEGWHAGHQVGSSKDASRGAKSGKGIKIGSMSYGSSGDPAKWHHAEEESGPMTHSRRNPDKTGYEGAPYGKMGGQHRDGGYGPANAKMDHWHAQAGYEAQHPSGPGATSQPPSVYGGGGAERRMTHGAGYKPQHPFARNM